MRLSWKIQVLEFSYPQRLSAFWELLGSLREGALAVIPSPFPLPSRLSRREISGAILRRFLDFTTNFLLLVNDAAAATACAATGERRPQGQSLLAVLAWEHFVAGDAAALPVCLQRCSALLPHLCIGSLCPPMPGALCAAWAGAAPRRQ